MNRKPKTWVLLSSIATVFVFRWVFVMIEGIRGSAAYRGGTSGDNGGILWVRNPVGLLWSGHTVLLRVKLYCWRSHCIVTLCSWGYAQMFGIICEKCNSRQLRGANGIKKLQRVNNMVTHWLQWSLLGNHESKITISGATMRSGSNLASWQSVHGWP